MTMYAVIQLGDGDTPEEMKSKLQDIDNSVYTLYANRGVFFLRYGGTAQQLADRIGFGKEHGAKIGIVTAMGQNYGFANVDLWNWMKSS